MRPIRWALAVLLLAPLALSSPASAQGGSEVPGSELLSDERTSSFWAHPELRSAIRQEPARTSPRIARLHFATEDGYREVYLVLRRWTDPEGLEWLEVRIPMRPNGRTGWVPQSALGELRLVRTRLV